MGKRGVRVRAITVHANDVFNIPSCVNCRHFAPTRIWREPLVREETCRNSNRVSWSNPMVIRRNCSERVSKGFTIRFMAKFRYTEERPLKGHYDCLHSMSYDIVHLCCMLYGQ